MTSVVGIDLSLTSTGMAAINPAGPAMVTCVKSKGSATATLDDRSRRLEAVAGEVISQVVRVHPRLVVIEQPAFSRQNGHMHDRSGLWWLVVMGLRELGYRVAEVSPTSRAKYGTGKGNAGKDAVLASVVRRYPDVDVNGNDQADALILAAMGARWLGHPIDDLPKTHLAAMDAVHWPEPPAVDGAA
jgi:crossover junction endodeoxyribonuclease RuvC